MGVGETTQAQAEAVGHWMAEADRFARGLGIRLVSVAPGRCVVEMPVTEALQESLGGRTGLYRVEVRRGDGTLVGLFTGTVFRRSDAIGPAADSADGQVGG